MHGPETLDAARIAAFFEAGFVVLRRVFDPDEVARAAAAFDRLLAMARGLDGTVMHRGSQFVVSRRPDGEPRIHRVVWCGAAAPELARLGRHPRLVSAAARLLGADQVVQLINQAHFKLPGDEVAFPWHQDSTHRRYGTPLWRDVNGRGSFVQTAVAIDPMTPDNGPLRFIPGSGAAGHIAPDPTTGALPPDAFDPADAVTLTLDPGDAVLFGPYVVHGSDPNRSPHPRRLFINGFASPGANRRLYPGAGTGRLLPAPHPRR